MVFKKYIKKCLKVPIWKLQSTWQLFNTYRMKKNSTIFAFCLVCKANKLQSKVHKGCTICSKRKFIIYLYKRTSFDKKWSNFKEGIWVIRRYFVIVNVGQSCSIASLEGKVMTRSLNNISMLSDLVILAIWDMSLVSIRRAILMRVRWKRLKTSFWYVSKTPWNKLRYGNI